MIIQFLPADLEHVGGYYYSSSFLINNNNMTIQVTSSTNLTMSIEASIDDDTYFELPDTSLDITSSGGIQSYLDGQEDLFYRIKLTALPTLIKVLV